MLYQGIRGLLYYNVEKQMFGQAHIWAGWAIFSAVREGDPELMKIEFTKDTEGKDDFIFTVDRSRLREHGFKAISEFLHKLHVYKSMGDYDSAKKFFDHYSTVDETMMKVREIVVARKRPRRIELQPNLFLDEGTQQVQYKGYDATHEGVIQSAIERYPDKFRKDVYDQWLQDADQVRMP